MDLNLIVNVAIGVVIGKAIWWLIEDNIIGRRIMMMKEFIDDYDEEDE